MDKQKQNEETPLAIEIRRLMEHYFPDLLERLNDLPDLRKRKKYELAELLLAGIALFIFKEDSRNSFNNSRKTKRFALNYKRIFGVNLPHQDTVHEVFKILDISELEAIKRWMLGVLLEKRVLHKYRLLNKWFCIAVDGTGYQKFDYEPYPGCPYREYSSGKKVWFQPLLEAKLVTPNGFSLSIATEWVVNGEEYEKQDCELKAFKRLAVKLKKDFPRLNICILADGLYPNNSIFDICQDNNWKFIFTLKDDQLKDIWKEVSVFEQKFEQNQLDKEYLIDAEKKVDFSHRWINNIAYKKHHLNWIECQRNYKKVGSQEVESNRFVHVTNIELSKANCQEISMFGCLRWNVENEGFNTQKNQGYNFQHRFSRTNFKAIQNYYQAMQIAHMINQLVELSQRFAQRLTAKMTIKHLWKVMIAFMFFGQIEEEQIIFPKTKFRYE